MRQKSPKLYEGMYILNSALTDDARKTAYDKIVNDITTRGGKVVKSHDMGRKRLAYQINGHREGHYYVIYFELTPEHIAELRSEYRLMEDLVRHMVITTPHVMEKIEFKQLVEE